MTMNNPVVALNSGLTHYGPGAQDRAIVEKFVATHYERHYQACIDEFYPQLLALHDARGLRACVGFRGAETGPLFLEQYLEAPVENLLRARVGIEIGRAHIVEVGGLAADGAGACRFLIPRVAKWLVGRGFVAVAFTATRRVSNSFRRLRLTPADLGIADPVCLHGGSEVWGRYYDFGPRVFAGRLAAAIPTGQFPPSADAVLP
ncbi:thermostable hemolysin [Spectribacter hydrogenooxidans]|uniref:Thermostable hemolysin n=1 Tax=Spectribacter hydrogenoxidans TaxID=3075608 RepID=A0ABU3C2U9_9GAMM|nr:thermostable hemolysin [Salinisphaera sp. W335]MDT0635875.1 thermostable hemolysin [Salinisphaera sp. W335]